MSQDYDFTKICRVCLEEGKMMPIFKVSVSKKIMACASVQVWQNDGLPSQICVKCLAKLHIAYQFRVLCERSDSKLRHHMTINDNLGKKDQINCNSDIQDINQSEKNSLSTQNLILQPIVVTNQSKPCVYVPCDPIIEVQDTNPYTSIHQPNQINYINTSMQVENYNIQNISSQNYSTTYNIPIQNNIISNQILLPPCENKLIQLETHVTEKNNEKQIGSDNSKKCTVCHKIFANNTKLARHMKIHSKERPYKCYVCSKTFVHNGNYKIHLRMHTDERPFKCTVCDKGCRQAQDLEKHMRVHTGEKPHKCTMCPKAFTTSSNLSAHIRTHTGEKPYVCCVCQKGFCQSNELTKHMRTHTGEKSHICDVCHKGFNGSSTLIVHRRLHTGEKPYVCDICNKAFRQNPSLVKHLKIYHKYDCSQCDLSFVSHSDLKEHTDIHKNKSFMCEICQQSFQVELELQSHICQNVSEYKEHGAEQKMFVCHICSKHCYGSDELETHHVNCHINDITEMSIEAT